MWIDSLVILSTSFALLLSCYVLLWWLSIKIKDISIVDIFWGPACALPAWLALLLMDGLGSRQILLTLLVTVWALRLAWHIGRRNIGHGEDPRYSQLRHRLKPGQNFNWLSLKQVFLLQAVLAWLISWPVQIGQVYKTPEGLGVLALLGAGVWLLGILFEATGDYQLKRFKQNPANQGKLMDRGLWAWTRHPNYFGDAMVWFGLALIAFEHPLGLITALSPVLMLHFLLNLSGKKLLEKGMRRRYPDYLDYQARVSGFFPMPPKNSTLK